MWVSELRFGLRVVHLNWEGGGRVRATVFKKSYLGQVGGGARLETMEAEGGEGSSIIILIEK